jgi:hypothetical protein
VRQDRSHRTRYARRAVQTLYVYGSFRQVQCYFDDGAGLSALSPGREISIWGRCTGLMGNVHLKGCSIYMNGTVIK